jgi:hypothetical protein
MWGTLVEPPKPKNQQTHLSTNYRLINKATDQTNSPSDRLNSTHPLSSSNQLSG